MTKLIFLNIGWMDYYQGLNGDQIEGGGSFVIENGYGHEMFNFLQWEGKMYGYVQTPLVNIWGHLDAHPKVSSVSGVLAVWCARNPYHGGTYIVGWYENATVYAQAQKPRFAANRKIPKYITSDIEAVPDDIDEYASYFVSAAEEDCYLIPSSERHIQVPRGIPGGMGRANIWYADSPTMADFRDMVIRYVRDRTEPVRLFRRKYGRGGEGPAHKRLKEWCANNPHELGLKNVTQVLGETEYRFISGDLADVFFEIADNRYAVVEVETHDPEPGAHQVLKYKTLLCAEKGFPVDSDRVSSILVAWLVPGYVRVFCDKYRIRYVEQRIDG